ncbi:antibiotic biosynthesis monooxygenase family protein [Marinospirillum perlucidum]|uniref:antibiotic biosynthesis monooxygenase family protein n=1 Tax=Marinospirillum perlucidum TaxID=1982602 RepID=UPI000DF46B98|nr:antibiotic biosynthesis monooxygenase [Marinospirillum perlucidum]
MFRVVYQWKVEEVQFTDFKANWQQTTNRIHETVPGALGSFMLRSSEDPTEVLTIAKWKSRSDWEAFWQNENPTQMQGMRQLGERVAVKVYDEIEDFTH